MNKREFYHEKIDTLISGYRPSYEELDYEDEYCDYLGQGKNLYNEVSPILDTSSYNESELKHIFELLLVINISSILNKYTAIISQGSVEYFNKVFSDDLNKLYQTFKIGVKQFDQYLYNGDLRYQHFIDYFNYKYPNVLGDWYIGDITLEEMDMIRMFLEAQLFNVFKEKIEGLPQSLIDDYFNKFILYLI